MRDMIRIVASMTSMAAGGLTGVAAAQEAALDTTPDDPPREASLTLETRGSYSFEADLESTGDYTVGRAALVLSYDIPVLDRSTLGFSLSTRRSEYDFSGATGLAPGGEPIGGATAYGLSARFIHPYDRTYAFIGGLSVEWSGEDGADFGDAAVLAGFGAVAWKVNDDLTLTFGIQATDQLEDDVRVLPVIGVEWQLAENLRLTSAEVGQVLADGGGAGLGLVLQSTEDLALIVGAAFTSDEFRLDETGSIPDGVLRDDRVLLGIGARHEPSEAVSLGLGIGAVVWSNIETLDASGSGIGDEDGDPAPFITAHVEIRF